MAKRRTTKRQRVTVPAEQSAAPEPVAETGNAEPESPAEDRYAVFRWTGPGAYKGGVPNCRALPRHTSVSLPACDHEQAKADGLTFVRWAGE